MRCVLGVEPLRHPKSGIPYTGHRVLPRLEDHGARTVTASEIDLEYRRRLKAMSPAEKIARTAAMLAWTRQQMARRIRDAEPDLSDQEVKWRVALKLYEREPDVVKLIQEHLARVSR